MKFAVVVFPGTSGEGDCIHVLKGLLGHEVTILSHKETSLGDAQCVILPGGASYGDYLRPGALAKSTPIMEPIRKFAQADGLVLGVGNGFQVLLEAGLLPGAMLPNQSLRFIARPQLLCVENTNIPFTKLYQKGQLINMPIAHGAGNYYLDPEGLLELEGNGQIVFRYADKTGEIGDNPNGSVGNIAGITNPRGNVLGMMPHPERSTEEVLGSTDGLALFQGIVEVLERGKA
jgi:phosphoribosylformylglycinamidine synthase